MLSRLVILSRIIKLRKFSNLLIFEFSGVEIGVQTGLTKNCCAIWKQFQEKMKQFIHVTVAGPLRNYFKFIFSSDQLVNFY